MFLLIRKILKEFRIVYVFILGILFPINFYLLRKNLNFPKINLLYKSEFSRYVKNCLSSISLKGKKFTAYRVSKRFFLYYKAFSKKDSFTSVELILNDKKKKFINAEDPRLFKYKNKILLYFQKSSKLGMDMQICLYDPDSKKTYKINSPFKFNGKNWIPISELNSLIFIYSINPLVILKVVDLNKGKMKAITKVKKNFKPNWNTQDLNLSFVGNQRGGSPMIKVGNGKYLGIGHSVKYFLKSFKQLGATQRAYIYFFDFKKKIYYTNYLTNNKISGLYCFGAELTRNKNMIKFYFSFSSPFNEYIISNIYLFNVELHKEKLIRIAKRGTKKKIDFISGIKEIK